MSDGLAKKTTVVVGGGVAGLNCASYLDRRSLQFQLLESSDGVGGRMRTDFVDGFRLDRGFQVFQSGYPEAKAILDYAKLELMPVIPGALVRKGAKWVRMVDPMRCPSSAIGTVFNSIGNLGDRIKLARLLWDVWQTPLEHLTTADGDKSTRDLLTVDCAFSESFINSFLVPWLSGIFLEKKLSTSANFFRFVLKMLSAGRIFYPRAGIQAIPDQLAGQLPAGSIELNCSVRSIHSDNVECADGFRSADNVVLALPAPQANQLLGQTLQDRGNTATTCIYFTADRAPVAEPILMLNGEQDGPINHVFVMTNASADLAPPGKALISVTMVGDASYESEAVRGQLKNWFGDSVTNWSELAVYRILQALPIQPPGFWNSSAVAEVNRVVVCGDCYASASLQGALQSGRLAAEQIAARNS